MAHEELQLGDAGRLYLDAFLLSVNLEAASNDHTDDPEHAAQRRRADLLMTLSEDRAVADFEQVVGHIPEDLHDTLRSDLLALRSDPENEPLYDLIDQELAELPAPVDFDAETRQFAHYFLKALGRTPLDVSLAPAPAPTRDPAQEPAESPAPTGEKQNPCETDGALQPTPTSEPDAPGLPANPEAIERIPLQATYYAGDSVLVLGDDHVIPFARKVGASRFSAEEEQQFESLRLKTLQLLNENPDKVYDTRALWEALHDNQVPFDNKSGKKWAYFVNDFLAQLTYEGQPLVDIDTSKPRRRYYRLGAYMFDFMHEAGMSGAEQETVFKFPNGTVVGGVTGRVIRKLLDTTASAPFTENSLHELLNPEELAKASADRQLLSTTISMVRSALRARDIDVAYKIHTIPHPTKKSAGNRPYSEYWMEALPYDPELQKELNQMYLAARYVEIMRAELEAAELPLITGDIITELTSKVPYRLSHDELDMEKALDAVREIIRLSEDDDYIEKMFEMDESDPRFRTLNHFFKLNGKKDAYRSILGVDGEASASKPAIPELNLEKLIDETPMSDELRRVVTLLAPYATQVSETLVAAGYGYRDKVPIQRLRQLFPNISIDEMRHHNVKERRQPAAAIGVSCIMDLFFATDKKLAATVRLASSDVRTEAADRLAETITEKLMEYHAAVKAAG